MTSGFAKVFSSLWDGTLADNWETWSLFVFLLAHADANGYIDMTHEAISRRSCIPLDKVISAIGSLEAPDPRSRNSAEQGRRIIRLDETRDWGWLIVNYAAYRASRDPDSRKGQTREATARWRENQYGEPSVSHGEPSEEAVSQGEPKQKQKQKQIESEPAGSTLFAELEAVVSTSPQPAMAHRLVKYLRDTGTTHHGCILAVLHHWHANLHKIDKPLAYYDRNGPARSAIIMQHNMAIAEQRQERLKRLRA